MATLPPTLEAVAIAEGAATSGGSARGQNGRPTVVALKYNHWTQPASWPAPGSGSLLTGQEGSTYEAWDAWPWRPLQRYPERIPIAAREMRARPFWTWNDTQTVNELFNGWTAGQATISRVSQALRITPTASSTDPRITSPDALSLPGDMYTSVVIKISRQAGTSWDGKLFFITDEDRTWDATKSITITQPGGWSGEQTITVATTGNAVWVAGVIRQIRFDFGSDDTTIFDVNSIEIIGNGSAKLRERVIGLPINEQWAVDWEMRTAYEHGVDVFAVCHFQISLSTVGKHDWYFDRLASSTVAEPIKYCIIGIYQAPYNTIFTSTAAIQGIADKYAAIITAAGSRYWTIDGRPVIQMFADANIASQMITSGVPSAYVGGESVANIKTALAYFVATIRARIQSTLGVNPYIVDQHNGSFPTWFGKQAGVFTNIIEAAGFDAATSYIQRTAHYNQTISAAGGSALNWPPSSPDNALTSEQLVRSYATMVECRNRNHNWIYNHSGFGIPYWPHVTVGWARYPWSERDQVIPNPEDLNWPSFTLLKQNFETARGYVDTFGPVRTGGIVTIYAWDEYGEGGVLAPTKGNGYSALQAMREGLRL